MATMSVNKYLICSSNIYTAPVEPNWMMHIPSSYYICKSEITLEEGVANQVTIVWFHFVLYYEYLDFLI